LIDINGDNKIVISELKEVLKSFGDFQNKEIFTIDSTFDLDNNGSITEQEFFQ